jgi:hypothetical protein
MAPGEYGLLEPSTRAHLLEEPLNVRKSSPRIGALALLSQVLLALLILGSDSHGQSVARDSQPSEAGANDRVGGIDVVASDAGGTQLLVTAGEPRFQAVSPKEGRGQGGEARVRLELAGFTAGSPPGAPNLPSRTVLVAIPPGARVSLSVAYGDERDYPGVSLSPVMQLGDLDVVAVTVWPASYDPLERSVRVAGRIEIDVITDGGQVGGVGAPGIAPGRSPLGGASVVNPEAAQGFVRTRQPRTRAPFRRDDQDFTDSANWVKIFVETRGLVRVDGSLLADAGVGLSTIDPATLRLFWGGGLDPEPDQSPRSPQAPAFMEECAIEVEWDGNGSMEPTDAVLFLGQGASGWLDDYAAGAYALEFREHTKVDQGVYWLSWGGDFTGQPRRIGTRDATPTGAPTVDQSRARIHFERNRRYVSGLFEGGDLDIKWERWWDANLRDTGATVFFPVTPTKPDLSQSGSLRLRLWGSTTMGRGPIRDHYVKTWFNSVPIFASAGQDTFIWNGPRFQSPGTEFLTSGRQDVESDELTLVDGENRVEIDVLRIFDPANPNRDRRAGSRDPAVRNHRAGDRRRDRGGERGEGLRCH